MWRVRKPDWLKSICEVCGLGCIRRVHRGSGTAVLSGAAPQRPGRAQGQPASLYPMGHRCRSFWLRKVVRNNGTLEELAFSKRSSEVSKPGRFLTAKQLCAAQVSACRFLSLCGLFASCFHRCAHWRVLSFSMAQLCSWGLSSGSCREQTAVKEITYDCQCAPEGYPALSTYPSYYCRLQTGNTGLTWSLWGMQTLRPLCRPARWDTGRRKILKRFACHRSAFPELECTHKDWIWPLELIHASGHILVYASWALQPINVVFVFIYSSEVW